MSHRHFVTLALLLCALAASSPLRAQGQFSSLDFRLLDRSRDAGLITDWRLLQHYRGDFQRRHAPERAAARLGPAPLEQGKVLIFASGAFQLPPNLASRSGVFYAASSTYFNGSGDWNLYLESDDQAELFLDGRSLLLRQPGAVGVSRVQSYVAEGMHSLLIKFTRAAAPFRVAVLPLHSGSRRRNSAPYLKAAPTAEDMQAE